MVRHIKNLAPLPEFSPTMLDGVERVVRVVRPDMEHVTECRRDVMDAIRMITGLPAFVPPSVLKQGLSKIAAELAAARKAIDKLPLAWRNLLQIDDNFLGELARVSEKSEELASARAVSPGAESSSTFLATKPSGGGRSERTAAVQKLIAAEQAFDLLNDFGRRAPTLTKDGEYLQLAGMLFSIATGRKTAGEMGRACALVRKNAGSAKAN